MSKAVPALPNSSLWADYFREKGLLVEENERGFISAIVHEDTCLIENWFVKEEFRKGVTAMRLVFKILKQAKEKKCKHFCGEIYKSDPLFQYILNMHQKFGMQITEEDEFHVITSKNI